MGHTPSFVKRGVLFLATAYAFGFLALGLQHMSNCQMLGSLHAFGGSNHYILPTGLLQAFFERYDLTSVLPSLEDTFGGGLVQVEDSDSTWINSIYPGDQTDLLSPRTRELL